MDFNAFFFRIKFKLNQWFKPVIQDKFVWSNKQNLIKTSKKSWLEPEHFQYDSRPVTTACKYAGNRDFFSMKTQKSKNINETHRLNDVQFKSFTRKKKQPNRKIFEKKSD